MNQIEFRVYLQIEILNFVVVFVTCFMLAGFLNGPAIYIYWYVFFGISLHSIVSIALAFLTGLFSFAMSTFLA